MKRVVFQNRFWRFTGIILLLVLLGMAVVWARAFYGAYTNYEQGKVLADRGSYVRAVTYFDRSLHWYTPFNPFVEKSARQLWAIGEMAEAQGDVDLALIAYRSIRRGFFAARGFVRPGDEWIKKSSEKIRGLTRRLKSDDQGSVGMKAMEETEDPSVGWSVMAVLGWMGWLAAMAFYVLAHWGPWRRRENFLASRVIWGGLFVVFFALWLLAMMSA